MENNTDALQHPPSFDQMVGLIEKLFKDYLEDVMKSSPEEIEKAWQRYKTLNHLYKDETKSDLLKENGTPESMQIIDDSNIEDAKELLREAVTQIEYLHQKFKETGSGNNILSRIETFLHGE